MIPASIAGETGATWLSFSANHLGKVWFAIAFALVLAARVWHVRRRR